MGTKPAIVCDMSEAPDSLQERFEAYRRLFAQSLIGRERQGKGIRFRFRATPGVEARVRDLAAREKACCAFFDFRVSVVDDEVVWDGWTIDDPLARQVLEEFYGLPDSLGEGPEASLERLGGLGLRVVTAEDDRRAGPG